jgi:hypothetical protein
MNSGQKRKFLDIHVICFESFLASDTVLSVDKLRLR